MTITGATIKDGELRLKFSPSADVYKFVDGFHAGEYEIKTAKQTRSLNANAYAWVLMDKIAERLRMSKVDVYRRTIKEIGGVSEVVCVQNKALKSLKNIWESRGIGWQTEELDSKINGCTNLILYYGSSSYDTKQMSALINKLVEDAKVIGIETLTPEQLEQMKGEWNNG